MAPRGRPRKRSTRMDAAVDAMRNLGFEEEVVTRTVRELLDIYGDDGWPFIEEYGYKELIEAILRDSETSKQGKLDKEVAEELGGSSNTASRQICSEVGDFAPEAENIIPSSICNNMKDIENRDTPLANEDVNGWKGGECNTINSNKKATKKERSNDICSSSGNPETEINSQNACAVLAPSLMPSSHTPSIQNEKTHDLYNAESDQTRADDLPRGSPRRRLPCYGWIDSDDEEEVVDLVSVGPAKRPTQFTNVNRGTDKAKRQSRWDLKPDQH